MRSLRLRRLVVVSVAGLLLTLLNVPPALAQPANDDFDSAAVIGALPFTDSISTAEATTADDDPFCNGNEHTVWYSCTPTQNTTLATSAPTDPTDCTFGPTHNTVWFSFTPTVSQPLNLDRSCSNYDGILSVLTD